MILSSGLKHTLEKETREIADVLFLAQESFDFIKCLLKR